MISVVIPTYNRKLTIARAIESVLKQSQEDLELLIIDDASTDGTEEFVKKTFTDPRIRYERVAENAGADAARNRALELVRGEFICYLDSDDEMFPLALERLLVPLRDAAFGIAAAPYRLPNGKLSSFDRPTGEIPFEDLLCERGMRKPKGWLSLVRMSAIGEIRWPLKFLQFIFFRRIAAKTRVYYISEPLGLYYFDLSDKNSVTNTRKAPNPELSMMRGKELDIFLRDFGPQILKSCPQNYGYYAYGAAIGTLLSGDMKNARRLAYAAYESQKRLKFLALYVLAWIPGSPLLLRALFFAKSINAGV